MHRITANQIISDCQLVLSCIYYKGSSSCHTSSQNFKLITVFIFFIETLHVKYGKIKRFDFITQLSRQISLHVFYGLFFAVSNLIIKKGFTLNIISISILSKFRIRVLKTTLFVVQLSNFNYFRKNFYFIKKNYLRGTYGLQFGPIMSLHVTRASFCVFIVADHDQNIYCGSACS